MWVDLVVALMTRKAEAGHSQEAMVQAIWLPQLKGLGAQGTSSVEFSGMDLAFQSNRASEA